MVRVKYAKLAVETHLPILLWTRGLEWAMRRGRGAWCCEILFLEWELDPGALKILKPLPVAIQ